MLKKYKIKLKLKKSFKWKRFNIKKIELKNIINNMDIIQNKLGFNKSELNPFLVIAYSLKCLEI